MSLGMDRFIMEQSLRERISTVLREFGEEEGWAIVESAINYNLNNQVFNSPGMQRARILALRGMAEHDV